MKKLLIVLLALLMVFCVCLAACQNDCEKNGHQWGDDGKCTVCGTAKPADEPGNQPGNEPGNEPGTETPDDDEPLTGEYAVDMDIPQNPNPGAEYTLARGENEKQVIIYWREKGHNYADNDIWFWADGLDGYAYSLHTCSYGAKIIVNVPATTIRVGFIVRSGSTKHDTNEWGTAQKVYANDRFFTLKDDVTEIYLTGANAYTFHSNDGGLTLKMNKGFSKMTISAMDTISYGVTPATTLNSISDIKIVDSDGKTVEIESISTIGSAAAMGTIKLKNKVDLAKTYTVSLQGYGEKAALPMEVFDTEEFTSKYNYDGNDLGATITSSGTTFKVWAPTASEVVLNLFSAGDGVQADHNYKMVLGDKGVWTYNADGIGQGTYYTYSVTTSAGTQEAVDPYAKSAGLNGLRGMVIDPSTVNPEGFADTQCVEISSYTEAIIWETHVRDFTNNLNTEYKGKFLGLVQTGLTNTSGIPVGIDYVKALGITHIHLLPSFDYKSVDESKNTQFNWGYDPQNYNVPEGSYSTNAKDGAVRVREYKQMVQGLHDQGIGLVMDVVYNHTYDANSNFNKIVPNYYYRYNEDGSNSGGSGCGNDTASERYMFSKFMVDSVSYWAKEYKLDGFRFDLMGLHDVNTMQKIEQAVHAINPNAILYGEGWTMDTAVTRPVDLATQTNINKVKASDGAAGAIAVFNDAIRDGLRGSVFDAEEAGYLGNPTNDSMLKVKFGIGGGERAIAGGANWQVRNAGVINYISAHDNHTLFDKLRVSNPLAEEEELIAMNRVGAAIVMLSKGTPFMQAGEEILRSKPNGDGTYNENSYNSSDEINNIRWDDITPDSEEYKMFLFYQGLIAIRKDNVALTSLNAKVTILNKGKCFIVTFEDTASGNKVMALINPLANELSYTLPAGDWSLVCNGTQAGADEISEASGAVSVPAQSVHVYVAK